MAFYVSQSEQLSILLYSLLVGMLFGVLYDIFRISRVMLTGKGIGKASKSDERLEAVINGIRPHAAKKVNAFKNRLVRLRDKTVTVLIFIEDLLFFLLSALLFAVFLFQVNFGQLRLYICIGAAVGFLIYYCTIAKISAALSGLAVSLIRLALFFMLYKIAKPLFIMIAKAISVPVNAFTVRRIAYASKMEASMLLSLAKEGFGAFK